MYELKTILLKKMYKQALFIIVHCKKNKFFVVLIDNLNKFSESKVTFILSV